ncbi:MAG: hypothetical protein ABTQ27_09060, partial [Amaricoccus sp.]|uniref:hypothetical protein n=1 Tax=Amaricoccus sp. TaxID=1872485 RepID=UPI00331648D4
GGANGDFWINTANWSVQGPKAGGSWPSAVPLRPEVEIVAALPPSPGANTFYVIPVPAIVDLLFDNEDNAALLESFHPSYLAPASMGVTTESGRSFLRVAAEAGADMATWLRLNYPAGDGEYRWLVRASGPTPATSASRGPEPVFRATWSVSGETINFNGYSTGPHRYASDQRQRIRRLVEGTITNLASNSVSPAFAHNEWFWLHSSIIGTAIAMKQYAEAAAIPGSWTLSASDATYAAGTGVSGIGLRAPTGVTLDIARLIYTPAALL